MRVSDLGPLSHSARRRDDSLLAHAGVALTVGLFAALVLRLIQGRGTRTVDVADLGPLLAVGGFYFWYFQPARYASYVGELGAMHVRRQALSVDAKGLMFHDAARVDVQLERVISDGVHQIYAHTNVRFVWRDEGGATVFAHAAQVREPDQQGDWTTRNELDPAALDGLPPEHPAVFGHAAVTAFRAYLDRTRGPYR